MTHIQGGQFLTDPITVDYDTASNSGDTVVTTSESLRYVVHRQKLGVFTPMTMDISLTWAIPNPLPVAFPNLSPGTLFSATQIINFPFINGGLFVDDTSEYLVELLKGPESGYNRKDLLDTIKTKVAGGEFWVSTNYVPAVTKQSQVIVVYSVGNVAHGSMLDPINVMRYMTTTIAAKAGARIKQGIIDRGFGVVVP